MSSRVYSWVMKLIDRHEAQEVGMTEHIEQGAATGARKVHFAYRDFNLCGTLTKHGRSRSDDLAMVSCTKCLAKLPKEAK